jgi:hypothetical protein
MEASSWPCTCSPTLSTGEKPHATLTMINCGHCQLLHGIFMALHAFP